MKVRSHRVNPSQGKDHGRSEHTRKPRPGTRERVAKPISLRRRPSVTGGSAAPKLPQGKPVRVASVVSGLALAVFGATLLAGAAGSPVLIAGIILVLYGMKPRSGNG